MNLDKIGRWGVFGGLAGVLTGNLVQGSSETIADLFLTGGSAAVTVGVVAYASNALRKLFKRKS